MSAPRRKPVHPGDGGETSVPGAGRVPKNHPIPVACGTLDELNSAIGFARAAPGRSDPEIDGMLVRIQSALFVAGSVLAGVAVADGIDGELAWIEERLAAVEEEIGPLRTFLLPGGTDRAARLHLARTICRRAERDVVAAIPARPEAREVVPYLNRLSLLFFELARLENRRSDVEETPWRAAP